MRYADCHYWQNDDDDDDDEMKSVVEWPNRAASARGVSPCLDRAVMSAPWSSNIRTQSTQPSWAAKCSAVKRSLSVLFTFAPDQHCTRRQDSIFTVWCYTSAEMARSIFWPSLITDVIFVIQVVMGYLGVTYYHYVVTSFIAHWKARGQLPIPDKWIFLC